MSAMAPKIQTGHVPAVLYADAIPFGPGADNRVPLLGLDFDILEEHSFAPAMEALVRAPGTRLVCPVNVDTLNQCQNNPWLRDVIRSADWVYPDGAGIIMGARLTGQKRLVRRVTAADSIYDLAEAWKDGRHSIYFLGGEPGVAERAAQILQDRWPGFRIVGTHHGFNTPQEEREIFAEINDLAPDVVAVGYGVPLEHELAMRYWDATPNVGVYWMVGALTTYIAGEVPRAPLVMRETGLEWLFRLVLEPRVKFRRYVIGNPTFLARVLRERSRG